jgi:hypothetical protein
MSPSQYANRFNENLDLLNDIISKQNKTGVDYRVTGLDENGMLTFHTPKQIKRWQEAQSSVNPKMVVTLEEAIQSEQNPQRVKDELTSDVFLQRYLAYEPIKQAAVSGGWMQKYPEFMKQLSTVKTWKYQAKNVRDFAWGSSRKFTWDAMPVTVEGKKIMCMSYYPKESYYLYSKYSTKVVAHTIKTYLKPG